MSTASEKKEKQQNFNVLLEITKKLEKERCERSVSNKII